jgi:photosystem II stability/assembly factor-like uncharacterized protein
MFDRKGRGILAVFLVLALAIPALGAMAAGSGTGLPAAAPDATPLTWTMVHQLPKGQFYYGIYFPTKDVGYAVAGPDWNVNDGKGAPTYISKTTDGGKTWTSKPIADTDGWNRGITCTDANNCWIAGRVNSKRILRTSDGGATWKPFTNQSGYPNWLWSTGWTGKGTTILAGTTCYDPNDAGAKANWLRSTDGQVFQGVVARPGVMTCYVQWDIECPVPGTCYSAGKDYTWRSADDGVTWKGQLMEPRTRQYGLSCADASTCWVVGKSPWIRSTTNAGGTWAANSVPGMPTNGQFWDVAMVSNKVGYAVGCDNVSTDNTDRCLGKGAIYKTQDGLTWLPIEPPSTADFMDVWAFSEESIFVVDWSGKIWHGAGAPPPTPTPTATATPATGMISGLAFNDLNGDSFQDENEPGLQGATLLIRRGRVEVASAVSGTDGSFRFTGIEPGKYTLECKQAPDGFNRSSFLGTFRIGANQEIEVFMAHEAKTASETPTPTPTATAQVSIMATPSYLPVITQ